MEPRHILARLRVIAPDFRMSYKYPNDVIKGNIKEPSAQHIAALTLGLGGSPEQVMELLVRNVESQQGIDLAEEWYKQNPHLNGCGLDTWDQGIDEQIIEAVVTNDEHRRLIDLCQQVLSSLIDDPVRLRAWVEHGQQMIEQPGASHCE
jgi:hypothetical protein